MPFPDIPDQQDLVDRSLCGQVCLSYSWSQVRMTFGETLQGEEVRYTSALLLSAEAAQQLAVLLKELLTVNGLWTEQEAEAGNNVKQP